MWGGLIGTNLNAILYGDQHVVINFLQIGCVGPIF